MGTMAGTTVLCTQYPARVTNYVAPNQSIEDQFDYDHEHSENLEGYNAEDSLHQDTLMYENQDVGDVTVDEEPFEDDQQ